MDSRYMRLRAAIVLAALTGVPLVAVLGTCRPWSNKSTPLEASSAQSPDSNAAISQPDGETAPHGRTAAQSARNSTSPVPQPARSARPAPKSPDTHAATTPKATIRGVRAAPTEYAPAGAERSKADAGEGRALDQVWPAAQERLEALGAVTWRLETWGSQGLYRFSCAVSLAGHSRSTRYFEAIAAHPETAVEQVVSEVEAFRAGQPATTAGRPALRR